VAECWACTSGVMGLSLLETKKFFKVFFNESEIIAGKFKGDKNIDEKFNQRFSKVLLVLVVCKCFTMKV